MNRSILDWISHDVARLQKGLGASDRSRLNEYLEDVREIERRIQRIEKYNASGEARQLAGRAARRAGFLRRARQADVRPAGAGLHDRHHARLGVQDEPRCQRPRLPGERREDAVPSLLASRRDSGEDRGVRQAQSLSRQPDSVLPRKAEEHADGDGNLLDHSLVLYGSPMGDANVHNHKRVPIFLAGHANGKLKGNLHVRCQGRHADGERAADHAAQARRATSESIRRQHGEVAIYVLWSMRAKGLSQISRTSVIGSASVQRLLLSAAADTRLSDAAMQGDRRRSAPCSKQKVDVNAAQGDGTTALHWAAFHDDLEMVQAAPRRRRQREGRHPRRRHHAAVHGLHERQRRHDRRSCSKAGADANSAKANGTTALMIAAASGSADAVKLLLDRGADVNAKESAHGQTALMFAAALESRRRRHASCWRAAPMPTSPPRSRKLERVRFDQDGNIVEDVRPAAATRCPHRSRSRRRRRCRRSRCSRELRTRCAAMHWASPALPNPRSTRPKPAPRAGDVAARAPRSVGPEVMGGMTALLYAAREGHMDAARALVEAGADVNQSSTATRSARW